MLSAVMAYKTLSPPKNWVAGGVDPDSFHYWYKPHDTWARKVKEELDNLPTFTSIQPHVREHGFDNGLCYNNSKLVNGVLLIRANDVSKVPTERAHVPLNAIELTRQEWLKYGNV